MGSLHVIQNDEIIGLGGLGTELFVGFGMLHVPHRHIGEAGEHLGEGIFLVIMPAGDQQHPKLGVAACALATNQAASIQPRKRAVMA